MAGGLLEKNLSLVLRKLEASAARSGRSPSSVTLVAVTKTLSQKKVAEAFEVGLRDFGENYIQEWAAKRCFIPGNGVRWHLIGGLQMNKCKSIAGEVELIHSVDRLDLAIEISKQASKKNAIQDILLQVNLDGEKSKRGIAPEELSGLSDAVRGLEGVRLKGLMTFPSPAGNQKSSRHHFRKLRELSETLALGFPPELSMGTSLDWEVAIEEGATLIRLGTALFGERIL